VYEREGERRERRERRERERERYLISLIDKK
jgi:hypothetical protein